MCIRDSSSAAYCRPPPFGPASPLAMCSPRGAFAVGSLSAWQRPPLRGCRVQSAEHQATERRRFQIRVAS
eukprot:11598043-Alexandrium_andersonii.AAC.1